MEINWNMKKCCAPTVFCVLASATAQAPAQANTYPWPTSGNVGIGTTGPGFPFEIYSAVSGNSSAGVVSTGNEASIDYSAGGGTSWHIGALSSGSFFLWNSYIDTFAATFAQNGNMGVGTQNPLFKLHVVNSGGFGGENADGTSTVGNVPIVAQSDNTAFGILNANNRQAFALNIDNDGGTAASRGVVDFYDKTNGNWHQDIALNNGSVGIGTPSPSQLLEVNGTAQIDGTLNVGNGGIVFPNGGGTQTTAWTGTICGGDYAESVDVTGDRTKYEPGDLLVIDPSAPGKFLKADAPYSTLVAGVYSTKPGTVGRRQTTPTSAGEVPMAVIGIVPTKVSAENGPIQTGDLLVASSTMGYAMKGSDRNRLTGAVIGKALGSLGSGAGVIEVLVTLQ